LTGRTAPASAWQDHLPQHHGSAEVEHQCELVKKESTGTRCLVY